MENIQNMFNLFTLKCDNDGSANTFNNTHHQITNLRSSFGGSVSSIVPNSPNSIVRKPEELRDAVYFYFYNLVEKFVRSNKIELEFPADKTTDVLVQRKKRFLQIIRAMGLEVYSMRRQIYNFKTYVAIIKSPNVRPRPFARVLVLSDEAKTLILENSKAGRPNMKYGHLRYALHKKVGSLLPVEPLVPPAPRISPKIKKHRESLAIFSQRSNIINSIRKNKFTVFKSRTGCGKTTQVPQYILEDAFESRKAVKIICCIPRRVGVVAVCDRVATERGPIILNTLGNKGSKLLETTTHIILDEIHARDRYSDFLITCCRDIAKLYPHMKFIFLGEGSAEDSHLDFVKNYCSYIAPVNEISIQSKDYTVQILHMKEVMELLEKRYSTDEAYFSLYDKCDQLIENVWKNRDVDQSVQYFLELAKGGHISIDYASSKTSLTMLMACTAAGKLEKVHMLIENGVDDKKKSRNGWTAKDWAKSLDKNEIYKYLSKPFAQSTNKEKFCRYQAFESVNDYQHLDVDFGIMVDLILTLCARDTLGGSILAFLPN